VDQDRPRVGPEQAGEDADQGRLAGAVLAEEAMHLAAAERDVDVVVGEDAGKRLRDPPQLDDRRPGVVRRAQSQRSLLETRTARGGVTFSRRGRTRGLPLLDQLLDVA